MMEISALNRLLASIQEVEKIVANAIKQGNLPLLERDLVLEKLRNAYDTLLFEKKQEDSAQLEALRSIKEQLELVEKRFEPQVPAQKAAVESVQPKMEAVVEEKPIAVEPKKEVETPKETPAPKEKEVASATPKVKPVKETPLGEKLAGSKKFRNEQLAHPTKDVSSVLQNKPIADLTKAIGINDKFLFTKELFSGNAELYAKSIAELNSFTDINDALIYIQDNFSWENDNEAAGKLIDLIRRKLLHT